ncbi:hypothetical protein CCR75_005860 [Bremia lactucae]|uniref:Uncharacterized protein n=1 Tax=Bremia lactucae TaxID=4779 RepID=A0A976IBZ4_BRELC|nr:hypothetical protein CCR75_005860 [Bremia lactucae]
MKKELSTASAFTAELSHRLSAIYQSPAQERIHYLEGRLVELMEELKSLKTKNKHLNFEVDKRDNLISKCRNDLIRAYETSMQTRADMLELLQNLHDSDLDLDTQETKTVEE